MHLSRLHNHLLDGMQRHLACCVGLERILHPVLWFEQSHQDLN
uniref:Uncharacterized protein n=1 Tax=Medicago truncatula TaxID=3880 RepID=I3S6N1_MEDTR|nr:unknown [Medicago truncatula]